MSQPYLADYPAQAYLATAHEATEDTLSDTIASAMASLSDFLAAKDAVVFGAPFVRYHLIDREGFIAFEVGYPVDDPESLADGEHKAGEVPSGRYGIYEHHGAPDALVRSHKTLQSWGGKQQVDWACESSGTTERWAGRFEHQLVGAEEQPDRSQWVARIAYLCR